MSRTTRREKTVMKLGVHVLPEVPAATRPTATAPRPSPSPATSLSSGCSARPTPLPARTSCSTPPSPQSLQQVLPTRWRRQMTLKARCTISSSSTIQRAQAHHLQRQRLRRRMDQGSNRTARPSEPKNHARCDADAAGKEKRRHADRPQDFHEGGDSSRATRS